LRDSVFRRDEARGAQSALSRRAASQHVAEGRAFGGRFARLRRCGVARCRIARKSRSVANKRSDELLLRGK
jgi:hypothetical protein